MLGPVRPASARTSEPNAGPTSGASPAPSRGEYLAGFAAAGFTDATVTFAQGRTRHVGQRHRPRNKPADATGATAPGPALIDAVPVPEGAQICCSSESHSACCAARRRAHAADRPTPTRRSTARQPRAAAGDREGADMADPVSDPRSCSSASTTPAARSWPPASLPSWPAGGSTSDPPARCPPTGSTRSRSPPWPKSASTSPASSPRS
jgi:hypothetical protein